MPAEILAAVLAPSLGVALSPFPIIGIVLVLTGPRATTAGPALATGFTLGLAALAAIAFALLDGGGVGAGRIGALVRLAVGLLLLFLAVRKWQKRSRPGETPRVPGWMASLHDITPGRAFAAGAALGGLNPKNIAFAAAAAAAVATSYAGSRGFAAALAFVLLGSASVLVAVAGRLVAGAAADRPLEAVRGFMVRNGDNIVAAILALLGAKLVLQGWPGLLP